MLAEAVGSFFQYQVAGQMAIGVVDVLEVVEIEQQQTGMRIGTSGPLQFMLKEIEEGGAIPEAGKPVAHGLCAQFLTGMNQLILESQDAIRYEQAGTQFRLAEWFSETVICAGLERIDYVLFIGAAGDHQDVVVIGTGLFPKSTAKLDAVDSRHGPIDDDESRVDAPAEASAMRRGHCRRRRFRSPSEESSASG